MNFVLPKHLSSLAILLLGGSLSLTALAADKPQSFTGKVSDAMCGVNHMMGGEGSECVRACIRKGSKYALVVGDKVFALDTSDNAALAALDKLADHQATVTGQATGETIAVSSVSVAK
jgi:hypothetical protein